VVSKTGQVRPSNHIDGFALNQDLANTNEFECHPWRASFRDFRPVSAGRFF